MASWLWGSLFRKFCSFCSLLVLQLLQPFGGSRRFCRFRRFCIPIFMHSLGAVWHPGSGVPWPLGAHSLTLRIWGVPCFAGFGAFGGSRRYCRFRRFGIPIFMHSLGDVWHPGSGVPCFAAFAAFQGSQSHFLPYIFPIFMHSLGDVWHPGSGVPWPLGAHSLTFFPISSLSYCIPYLYLPYLHAFLR